MEKIEKKRKMPKEVSQEIMKKIVHNLLRTIAIMAYFIILNLAYTNMAQERLIGDIKVFATVFMALGIFILEKAYKKDSGQTAITAIEVLCLSIHSLSIMHIITFYKYDFRLYLLTSSYIIDIYYVLKSIIIYTKARKEYLNNLSDISEIVKKEKPVKKEAKKRTDEKEIKQEQEENKTKEKEKEEIQEKKENKTEKVQKKRENEKKRIIKRRG